MGDLRTIKPLPEWLELLDRFEYLPGSGDLVHKYLPTHYFDSERACNIFNAKFAGEYAGNIEARGYRSITIAGQKFKAHRIVWKWVTGEEPEKFIDHVNGNRADNRFENLKEGISTQQNACNQKLYRSNTSGVPGVTFNKQQSKWFARGSYNSNRIFLGVFNTFEEAKRVRESWQKSLPFSERHGS